MSISDKEILFNNLAQSHWDSFARETLALIKRDNKPAPQVFISYAWPKLDEERDIQAWLLSLHERLTHLGVKVLFDIKSMTLGTNIDEFMQQGVTNSDTILIIGTETYFKRSNEPTNVQREVEHIRQKVAAKGTGCVIPILYRGQFWTALPALGINGSAIQVLGTDCHDELLYHNNLPSLIESLFQLQGHAEYQTIKQTYLAKLKDIESHGLSDTAVADFAKQRAQKARAALAMQQEAVNLMLERNAKEHPDYVARPLGSESASVKLLSHLKTKYSQYTHVHALFGEPMALEGQYINVQMLYQVSEEKKQGADDTNKEFKDARVSSFESIFSKKEPLEIKHLFTPAKRLLTDKQRTNEARPDLPPNLVLLQGRAGIGKTTFVYFVTREWAMGRLWQEYNWVFSLRFRDLRSGAFQQASDRGETWRLEDWIYQAHFAAHMDKFTFQTLWSWLIEPDLSNKRVLFILDGYDEMPDHHPCEQALTDLLSSDTPKILTSRPYGLSDLSKDRRELEIVGFVDENVEKYVALYFKNNTAKAQNIIRGLKAVPTLWGSAHIPVTLNVLCGVLETETDISASLSKLNTMSGLYETMELALLERAYRAIPGKETEHKNQLMPLDKIDKMALLTTHYKTLRYILGRLAFTAFAKQQLILTPQDVSQVLKDFGVPVTEIAAKIKELLDLGLLKKVVDEVTHLDTNYEFLHLTFQEYYAGHHLLWGVEQNIGTMIDDFAKIKLDPKYQLVLWFVAGTIKEKNQFNVFMRALAAPVGGDMLGNVPLGLMVRCTAENWALAQETGWSKAITKMLQKRIQGLRERFKRGEIDSDNMPPPVWVNMINLSPQTYQVQTGELDLFPDALKKANSFYESKRYTSAMFINWLGLPSPTILNTLSKLLADSDGYVGQAAGRAIGKLGAVAATSDILSQLVRLLVESPNYEYKGSIAAGAIGNLGALAATPEFLALLAKLLADSNKNVRCGAAEAIAHLGEAAATNDILAQLARLSVAKEMLVREAAAGAIGNMGVAAATPEFLALLAKLLADSSEQVREAAAGAIGNLGASAATPEFLALLAKLLEASDWRVRQAVARAIGKLGAVAATSDILAQLAKLLADSESYVRIAALNAIGGIGAEAATKDILALLVKLLSDSKEHIRIKVLDAIRKLGAGAASLEFIASLAKLLADENEGVREDAVRAIGNLGEAAATKDILVLLAKLLADSESSVRMTAVEAIGKLGAEAATKDILALVAKLLVDSDGDVRAAVAYAIGKLGAAAATEDILVLLAKLLVDSNEHVRADAAYAIGKLGAAAATKDILVLLAKLLVDNNKRVRIVTSRAIGELGPAASTRDILAQLVKMLADNSEDVRKTAAEVIGGLGAQALTYEHMIELIRLLANEQVAVAHILPNLVSTYLGKKATTALPETPFFPVLATVLISGAYISGNASVSIAHDAATATYQLRGFADKTLFHISITHAQAQWFIYWTPQIIQSIDEGTLGNKLAEIEKAGMTISSQKSVAWFDQSYISTSSSSVSARPSYPGFFQPKAYGLSNDAVIGAEQEQDNNCVLM